MSNVLDPTLDPAVADEVYEVVLEKRRRGPVGRVVAPALDLWCAMFGGLLELTSAGEVVVRRRHDGVEELRMPGGASEDAAYLIQHLRTQLAELDPQEFRETWGITGDLA